MPLFASVFRRKIRSDLAIKRPADHVRAAPVRNRYPNAGFARQGGSPQLGPHSSGSKLPMAVAEGLELWSKPLNRSQYLRAFSTVRTVQAVHISEEQQPVSTHRLGQKCAELVVVAECADEF